ncbi:hypothetical protein [Paenibacillus sp. XY044]|uniref:hypothetical protein n=1 Tax=Paenibacillus sp. XY044 TaxID=2026089 RepID=UPI000B983570|nr:hypothetical protein [Paenibacillus sp. XY044]OZB90638.1 hypothetical protein CJP46_32965 [Paenibacillus sp. XY044]
MKRSFGLAVLLGLAVLTACESETKTIKGDGDNMNMSHDHHSAHGSAKTNGAGETAHEHGGGQTGDIQANDVNVSWTYADGQEPAAGVDTKIRMAFTHGGKAIESFETTHEQKEHLIIVSKDLSYFHHIHPEYLGGGVFEVNNRFPAGGDYKLIADFVPEGGGAMNKTTWLQVKGAPLPAAPVKPDVERVKTVDGLKVTLGFDRLAAGQELMLTYTIEDAGTGEPVTDLQPYLGAVGHVVILSEDAEQYLHVHPMDEKGSGPKAEFMTTFPHAGVYKIWGQFQRDGRVITVPFVVSVP